MQQSYTNTESKLMLEKQIEAQLKRGVEKLGGLCLKFVSPGTAGVPDRIILIAGECIFVELKRPDGKLSPLQEKMQQRLRDKGFKVFTLWSPEEVNDCLYRLEQGISRTWS